MPLMNSRSSRKTLFRKSMAPSLRDSLLSTDHLQEFDDVTPGPGKSSESKKRQEEAEKQESLLKHRHDAFVIQYLVKKTHFDKDEVRNLQIMYRAFKGNYKSRRSNANAESLDRLRFREMISSLFGITDSNMLDQIFGAFDQDRQGSVSEVEWILGLSGLLRGSLDQQMNYSYDVYDINRDRSIGREEIYNTLKGSLNYIPGVLEQEEVEDATKDLADLVTKKFATKHNGEVGVADYKQVISHDPLLLELLGECLPKEKTAVPFVALFSSNPRKYKEHYSLVGDKGWTLERERYDAYRGPHYHNEAYLLQMNLQKPPPKKLEDIVAPAQGPTGGPKTHPHHGPRKSYQRKSITGAVIGVRSEEHHGGRKSLTGKKLKDEPNDGKSRKTSIVGILKQRPEASFIDKKY